MDVTIKTTLSGGNGFPRAQPRRGSETASHQGQGFLAFERVVEKTLRTRRMRLCAYCLMPNHWHFVVWPERDDDLSAFMQQLTNTHVKRWKEHRHEIGYGHLSTRALQVFPGRNRRLLLPGRPLRGAERSARQPRGASGIVALVESAPWGARRPGVSRPRDVASAPPDRLAATCQPTANRSRGRGVALLRQPRSALRRSQPGQGHGAAIGAGIDASAPGQTEETVVGRLPAVTGDCPLDFTLFPHIWWLSPFTTRHLLRPSPFTSTSVPDRSGNQEPSLTPHVLTPHVPDLREVTLRLRTCLADS